MKAGLMMFLAAAPSVSPRAIGTSGWGDRA